MMRLRGTMRGRAIVFSKPISFQKEEVLELNPPVTDSIDNRIFIRMKTEIPMMKGIKRIKEEILV
jgi:hypothetical protein